MKKLMTTVSAVALALGLYATDTGTSFEGLAAGDYDITATTGELSAQAAGESYWDWGEVASTGTLTVVDGVSINSENRPDPYQTGTTQTRYLNVKTTLGNPVARNVSVGGAGTAIGDGFYFDSLVKFTAFDEDPTINLDGGKLAIWLKEDLNANDEPTATNLMVTAGYLTNGSAIQTNYQCAVDTSVVNLNDGGWHRVTVKAINSIYKESTVRGFAVYIDGQYVTAAAEKGIVTADLTDNAKMLHVDCEGALFPSADYDGTNCGTISAVAFDGQGDVDDLLFTATAPSFAADREFFTIQVGANVASVTYTAYTSGGDTIKSGTISADELIPYEAGMYVDIAATPSPSYVISGIAGTGVTKNGQGYYVPSAAGQSVLVSAAVAGATIVGGDSYETASNAFAAISGGSLGAGPFTVVLNTAATSGVELNNASASVILDLHGNNITAGANDSAAIVLWDGTLLVTNSTETVGQVNGYDDGENIGSAVVTVGGALTIAGGIYNGAVDVSGATTKFITGGEFSVADNKASGSQTTPPAVNTDLAAAAAAAGNQLVVGSGSASYYVVTKAAATVSVTVTGGANATAAWTVDDVAVAEAPATLTEGQTYSVTYTAKTGYEFLTGAITTASGTAGTTPIAITIANAVAATYNITCVLGGGTQDPGSDESYTYNSAAAQTKTIVAPTYEGGISNFTGWTISPAEVTISGTTLTIPAGQTGAITLTANWEEAQNEAFDAGTNIVYATAQEANIAASLINANRSTMINVPAGISDENGAYTGLFYAYVEGTTVTIDFTSEAAVAQTNLVTTKTGTLPLTTLAEASSAQEVSLTGLTPGLWYSVSSGTSLTNMAEGTRVMANSEGAATLPVATYGGTSGFYRINVNPCNKPAPPPNN